VFAGWLGERAPLESWTEADATGLPVTWVVTTPWIGWNDDKNWDNRPVADQFALFLAEAKPDLVHFHSLQSIGAGLLPVATAAGARVVVTMHDFWWFCSRQFLVDRSMQPCSVVVDAGGCACEVDRPWLNRRNDALREMLRHADLVLAPSASAARVLAANGVDPSRLRVNENGLPTVGEARARRREPRPAAGLRLLYVGGPNPLKGVHVLIDAARRLAARPGWSLVAYGAEDFVRERGVAVDGLPIEFRPAFDPAGADGVYGEADVLVLPSVMRESHSLVTREALGHGLPVVCTDTFGPEEVVTDGHNGLIVPAADAPALACAMQRILDEPDLLPRLRSGCDDVPPLPALEEQVDALEGHFERLLAPTTGDGSAPHRTVRRTVRRVLFLCGIVGAPLRYRAWLPAEGLGFLGIESEVRHYRDADAAEQARSSDAVVVYRVPATEQVLGLIADLRGAGIPVFFDVDDLIFDPNLAPEIPALAILPPAEAELWLQGVRRYRMTMDACDAFIGSTAALCRHAQEVTGLPVERFDNGVGLLLARLSDEALRRPREPGPLRIGYLSGSNTHDHDWYFVEAAVAEVLDRHADLQLWLVGHVPASDVVDRFASRVVRRPIVPWRELPGLLRHLDLNLAPLAPGSRFNEAKSSIKWLEAGLTGTPTIASPTEPFREVVQHGRNGWLAGTPEEWSEGLRRLLADEGLRQALGRRARRDGLLQFSPHVQGRRYLEILEAGRLRSGEPPPPAWPADVLDEPPLPMTLEPYGGGDAIEAARPDGPVREHRRAPAREQAAGGIVRRALETFHEHGSQETVLRAARRVRRRWLDRRR
jgi:glycosyltransferase involved in cell wall biosynthesis